MNNNLKKFSLFICSLVLFFNQAIANTTIEHIPINKIDMNIAENLYNQGQYKKSFLILKSLAKQGYALAQYSVGYMYLNGQGVTKSNEKAQFWINKAAQQGFRKAVLAKKILISKYKKEKRNNLTTYNNKNNSTTFAYNDKKPTAIKINKNKYKEFKKEILAKKTLISKYKKEKRKNLITYNNKNNSTTLAYNDKKPANIKINKNKRKRKIVIDLHNEAFGAYNENGKLVRWGPISAGKDCGEFEDSCSTPKGKFRIYRKENKQYKSKKYPEPNGGAPMPYAMFFNGGIALHGSVLPGRHASHGCVRLLEEDAKWLNLEFSGINTKVIVQ